MKKIMWILALAILFFSSVFTVWYQQSVLKDVPIKGESSLNNPDFSVPEEFEDYLEVDVSALQEVRYAHLPYEEKTKVLLGGNTPCADYKIKSGMRVNNTLKIDVQVYDKSKDCIFYRCPDSSFIPLRERVNIFK